MFDARQFIRDQRDGVRHAPGAVRDFVAAFTRGDVPEYQVTAWLMACFFRPPSEEETFELTDAMLHSGEVIRFHGGVVMDMTLNQPEQSKAGEQR